MHVCIGLDFIKLILINVEQMGLRLLFYSIAVSHADRCFTLNTAQCISKVNTKLFSQNSLKMCFSISQSVSSPCLHLLATGANPQQFPKEWCDMSWASSTSAFQRSQLCFLSARDKKKKKKNLQAKSPIKAWNTADSITTQHDRFKTVQALFVHSC